LNTTKTLFMKTTSVQNTRQDLSILNAIYSRRAVRRYSDAPVENDFIGKIMEAGKMAPSAMNRQPWKFYVVRDKTLISSISGEIVKVAAKDILKPGLKQLIKTAKDLFHGSHFADFFNTSDPVFHGAPVVIFITAPKDNEWAPIDIGMCSQNMMLAAKAFGLDSCPIGFAKYVTQTKIYSKLGIPKPEAVILALIFGYGKEDPKPHERITGNVVYVN
jgi:nitroreductase